MDDVMKIHLLIDNERYPLTIRREDELLYKNYSNQSIKDSIFPPFSTYHLSSLLITVIPASHITHIHPSQFSFHTQTTMKQIVNMKRESILK